MKKLKQKNRNERRRLQLNKANSNATAVALEKVQGLNKRVLALVLAVVMVLGLLPLGWFSLKGKADETDQVTNVTMTVRANGANNYTTAEIASGDVSENVGSATFKNELPQKAEFQKALVVDANAKTETEIASVGAVKNGDTTKTYYSLEKNSNSGTLLKDGQSLVLVMAAKYNVTVDAYEHGKVTTSAIRENETDYVWGGEDLRIQATPDQDYYVKSITYKVGTLDAKNATVLNNATTIKAFDISDDVVIRVTFEKVSAYSISEVQNMSSSKYYPNWVGADNHGGITNGVKITATKDGAEDFTPGQPAVFYLFSESSSGGNTFYLNMLSVNGVDLAYPSAKGQSKTTPFGNSGTATVTMVEQDTTLNYKNDPSTKHRSLYKVEITDVHENLEVAFNFREASNRQIIIKGLRGIEQTGYSVENQRLLDRYYTLTKNKQHLYTSYYTWGDSTGSSWYPSNNLALFTVKPGYNPYTVTTEMSYDGAPKTAQGIRDNTLAGDPETVIKSAGNEGTGRYDTAFRYWGRNTKLDYNHGDRYGQSWLSSGTELLLTNVANDTANDWYAVALAQNISYDQQLYLNAIPYNYSLSLDTQGGSLSESGYSKSGDNYIENAKHTVEDEHPYLVLPANKPSRGDDYIFEGWQLIDADGKTVNGKVYQSNEQVPLSKEILATAYGDKTSSDLTIRLQAIWKEIAHADTTKVSTEILYQTPNPASNRKEFDGKVYEVVSSTTETQPVNEETALINAHQPSAEKYYQLNAASYLQGKTVAQTTAAEIPTKNQFQAIYDLKQVDISLQKTVYGTINASEFTITLTLNRPADYPLSTADTKTYLTEKAGITDVAITNDENTITITKTFSNGDLIEFEHAPYGWSYEVSEARADGDNFVSSITAITATGVKTSEDNEALTGTLEEDTDFEVVNQRKNDDPNIVSDKWLEKTTDGHYKLTMETYAIGKTVSDEDAEAVPLDIALVIDQSGSMGTEDMSPRYTAASRTSWTVDQATSGKTYFYKVGEKYYPVQAQEGTIYEPVTNVYTLQMIGVGHDGISVGVNGAPTHFNVPTSYYTIGVDGNPHRVWMITAGMFLEYYAYPYYYLDENDTAASKSEWTKRIYWAALVSPWDGNDYSKLRNDSTWKTLTDNSRVRFVGYSNLNQNAAKSSRVEYSWISNGDAVKGLYLPKEGTTYNGLYYVNDDGEKVQIGKTAYTASTAAYTGTLYEVTGISRVTALQSAVSQFTKAVAENAQEKQVDHRIGIIGFAGNKFPASSAGKTAYNTTTYDYTNTGLFLNDSFKNYQQIIGYQSVSQKYINVHYYTTSNGGDPVYYSGGKWYYVSKGTQYTGSAFYEPVYADLTKSDYEAALVEASQKNGEEYDGTVNANLMNAIQNFANYGGTYTSYGMHMANKLFENNSKTFTDSEGNERERKRVIIVFTDGEPGANGYSSSIAGEALVDGNSAKYALENGGLDATVYTIGLFPGNASSEVKDFMQQLSSEYTVPVKNVYAAANVLDGGTRSSNNNYGAGGLDPQKTYYYTDTDEKTYAVTTKKDGLSTLGWWVYDGSYIRKYPKTQSDDTRTVNGTSVTTFYNASGNAVYEGDLQLGETYYTDSNSKTRKEIHYEYRWYNSNNSIREPKISESGQGIQFFELGTPDQNPDGNQYYYDVKNQAALEEAFASAFELIKTSINGTAASLTAGNSLIRDVLSEQFEVDGQANPEFVLETIDGTWTDGDRPVFDESTKATASGVTGSWNPNTKTLDIRGFDFSETYVAKSKEEPGKKLRITITGLKPKDISVNGIFESNTGASGVYKLDLDEDNSPTGGEKLIDAFPLPSISRHRYIIDVDGDDKTATWNTTFTWKGLETSPSESPTELMNYAPANAETWAENGTIQNVEGKRQRSIVLEEIRNVDQFEMLLLGDEFKHGDAIPDNYQIQFGVTGTGMNGDTYDYTKQVNGGDTETYPADGSANPSGVMKKDEDTTVHISSEERDVTVSIQEITQPTDPGNDYSDPEKVFDVEVTLLDRNGQPVAYENDDISFGNNGKTVLQMKHRDSKTFSIPVGYRLQVDVRTDSQGNYMDSYKENGADKDGASYASGAINTFTSIQVINSMDAPVVTGFDDVDSKVSPVLLATVAGLLLGGACAAYVYRRKRLTEEQ